MRLRDLAGSLQDVGQSLVMGKTTFGKGSVQQLLRLVMAVESRSRLHITT
jgi:C-terminal processing protease CtpA/Prc